MDTSDAREKKKPEDREEEAVFWHFSFYYIFYYPMYGRTFKGG